MNIKKGLAALALGASLVGAGCEKKAEEPASAKKEVYVLPKECSTIGLYNASCKLDPEHNWYTFTPIYSKGKDRDEIVSWKLEIIRDWKEEDIPKETLAKWKCAKKISEGAKDCKAVW